MKIALTISTFLIILASTDICAQQIQWASEVISYSSEFAPRQYSAEQILGKPNVLPNLGASPNAWTPKKKRGEAFIKVGFELPIPVRQIAIAETLSPGSVRWIYAYDEKNNEHLLHEFEPRSIPIEGRLFRLFIDPTPYKVAAIKLIFDAGAVEGHIGIDAIAISDSSDPITVEINITDEVDNDYLPIALGPEVNTPYLELRPLITPDANTLFFSRRNHPDNVGGESDDEDIWLSTRDSATGNWTTAVNIGQPLNNKGPNFISSIIQGDEGIELLLGNAYYTKNRMTQGASMSRQLADGSWDKPENLKIRNDYNRSDKANYFLSHDQQTMVMSIERKDTYGGRDLYVSFSQGEGQWTQPLNMGDVINSADEEASPFLSTDGSTLFFSSKGFSGYGGYDIYLTRRLDDTWTSWSEPENLGASFNSRDDDIFFNFTETDEYAYFSRGTPENTDIYRVKLPYYQKPSNLAAMGPAFMGPRIIVRVIGRAFNAQSLEPIEASIEFMERSEAGKITLVSADTSGYSVTLPENLQYDILARSEGYFNVTDTLSLMNITESVEIRKDFYLEPIVKNQAIVLDNVYFEFDSDVIRSESFPELNKVTEMLLDNPGLNITIEGHTCALGSDAYNLKLSQKRAAAIARYFSENGVGANRVAHNGFGEMNPIASNETEEGREMNRRVEFQLEEVQAQVVQ
jgi:outer membrane protein OmpA-like peptidoglycan-associated protein